MRTAILSTALAALASAVPTSQPRPSESIAISKLIVRKYVTGADVRIDVVDFRLAGDDAAELGCTTMRPAFPVPTEAATCGTSKYRFSLHPGSDGAEFSLRVYHELGTAFVPPSPGLSTLHADAAARVGFWGQANLPTVCRAGGAGPGDYVCEQVAPLTIVIDNTPPPVEP